MEAKNWFELLVLAREIGRSATFSSVKKDGAQVEGERMEFGTEDFAGASGLSPKDASAWISKFVRWGYAARVGSIAQAGLKSKAVYTLTEYGRTIEAKKPNRLKLLIDAVESFVEAINTESQGTAFRNLQKVLNEIKELEYEKSKKRTGKPSK